MDNSEPLFASLAFFAFKLSAIGMILPIKFFTYYLLPNQLK